MNPRIVLLGGTGLFGSALRRELQDRGSRVVVVARGSSRRNKPDIALDLTKQGERLAQLLEPGDSVVYLLGRSPLRRPRGGRRSYAEVHLRGAANALAAAEASGAGRFFLVSALGVSTHSGAAYAETKAKAEVRARSSDLATTVVAPSILFGKGSEIIATLRLLARLPVVPLPRLAAPLRPIYVGDAARLLADALLSNEPPDRLELVGPERMSFTEIASLYLEVAGTTVLRLPTGISHLLIKALSRIRVPLFPAEIEAMLSIDNAGGPPSKPEELVRFREWIEGCRS